eukprot:Stramenopile-MAST_4_protein_655
MSKKEEEKKDESAAHPSAIFDFLRVRVQRAFKHLKQDKFTKGFDNEENTRIVNEFCKSEKGNNVVLAFTGDNVRASFGMPSTGKGRSIYFIKRPGTIPLLVEPICSNFCIGPKMRSISPRHQVIAPLMGG